METHGNAFQQGFPDLYATHARWGPRWIEIKNPVSYDFTPAQAKMFPMLSSNGTCIWILIADTDDEYAKLFGPHNWEIYYLRRGLRS